MLYNYDKEICVFYLALFCRFLFIYFNSNTFRQIVCLSVPLEAYPEANIRMQVVYLSGEPRNSGKECGSEAEKGKEPTSGALSRKLLLRIIGA